MRFLLDTHTLIWFITDDLKLPLKIKNQIESGNDEFIVSIVSFWEISIKIALGKLALEKDVDQIFSIVNHYEFTVLPLAQAHIVFHTNLPLYHRDPFDRMLIAQAMQENLTIITKDKEFSSYPIKTLWD